MKLFEQNELDRKVMADVNNKSNEAARPRVKTDQFLPFPFSNINDPEWRFRNRCSLSGWMYIASRAVRAPGAHDEYDLFHRYWDDNRLAAAVSVRVLADAFRYKQTKKPREWIKDLEAEGAFIIEKLKVPGKPEPANIYVLGEFKPDYFLWYYGNMKIARKDWK